MTTATPGGVNEYSQSMNRESVTRSIALPPPEGMVWCEWDDYECSSWAFLCPGNRVSGAVCKNGVARSHGQLCIRHHGELELEQRLLAMDPDTRISCFDNAMRCNKKSVGRGCNRPKYHAGPHRYSYLDWAMPIAMTATVVVMLVVVLTYMWLTLHVDIVGE